MKSREERPKKGLKTRMIHWSLDNAVATASPVPSSLRSLVTGQPLTKLIKQLCCDYSMMRGFAPRLYQQTIFSTAAGKNTLVALPTNHWSLDIRP